MSPLLLLLAVPVALAYLRPPPPARRTVGSLIVFRRMGPTIRRPSRARLRDLVSLALVLGALAAGVAALGPRSGSAPPAVWALVDTSPSMGADAGGARRLDRGLASLRAHLRTRPDVPAGLIALAPLRVHLRPTLDQQAVLEAARTLPAGAWEDPTALLEALCRGDTPPELILVSDRRLPDAAGCAIRVADLGEHVANEGITRMMLRPVDALGLAELWIEATDAVTLEVDGEPLSGGAGLTRLVLPDRGTLTARTGGGDALAADDAARIALDRGAPLRVLLQTTTPRGPTATALAAHPRVALQTASPGAPLPTDADLVVVEDGDAPALPAPRVVFGPGPGPQVRDPAPIAWEAHDPLLRYVDLEGVRLGEAGLLALPDDATPLITTGAGVLAARLPDGTLRFGFDPRSSDLGLREAFVHLVANLVEEAAPDGGPVLLADGVLDPAETGDGPIAADPVPQAASLARAGALLALLLLAAESLWLIGRRR